ncbi:MAG TPA: hypothetical protein V6D05_18275, partial [Stenomitos sp.]
IPLDGALIPAPQAEDLGAWLPRGSAVYVRMGFNPALANLISNGLSGLGIGDLAAAMPYAQYLLPGLHAMAGYPLLVDAIGTGQEEQAFQAVTNLQSADTQRLVMALLEQTGREAALALYPPPLGANTPMGITLVARVKDPAQAGAIVQELAHLLGPKVSDSLRVEGDRLSFSTMRTWERGLQDEPEFKRAIAHLPEDRFATMYVDAARLRELQLAYEQYLKAGGELGAMMLAPMAGLMTDPALGHLLDRIEREGGDRQHLALAATNRLGLMQGFTYSDWQPQDPAGLRQEAAELLRSGSARSYAAFASLSGAEGPIERTQPSQAEQAQFLKELFNP